MIQYTEPTVTEDDIKAVEKVLRSKIWTQGSKVKEFEDSICEYVGCRFTVACNSATSGLFLAYKGLGVREGVEVVTTPITYPATANMIIECGGTVRFQFRTMLVGDFCVPVHLAGVPQPAYGKIVVEDASHALGSEVTHGIGKKSMVGSCYGTDACVFSTHAIKNVPTGEGGLVCTNDEKLADFCRLMRSHGMKDGECVIPGYNFRMTDIQAALGISQLKRINKMRSLRQEIVDEYNDALFPYVTTPAERKCSTFWHIYIIGTNKKVKLHNRLLKKHIATRTHYPPVYSQPFYRRLGYSPIPEADEWVDTHLTLPLHCNLTGKEISRVIEEVKRGVK